MRQTTKNVICLGGINKANIKKTKLLKINHIASISMYKKVSKKS